jgi:iron complex outermembrane receptor protein
MSVRRWGLGLCLVLGSAAAQEPPAETPTIPVEQIRPADAPPPPPADGPTRIEEIIVTAQKTRQSVRDVPISMSVMTDKFIAEHGIVDIVQAMQFVPNVKIASGGFFAAPQARGFSFNNNNKAFESPLGIAFDGIPYTNTTYFNAGLFDIDRVEVLRGPQGTTFGKNTTAGLVSIVTADPTPDFSGVFSVQGGQIGRRHAELALSGPIWEDVVEFRVAGIYDDHGGFVHNTTHAVVPSAREELRGYGHQGYRAKLRFPDLFGSTLKIQYESVDLNNSGAGVEIWNPGPVFREYNRRYDPNADFTLGNFTNSEDGPDFRDAHTDTFVGEWNIPIGDWTGVILGGRSVLVEALAVDTDFSPVPGINGVAGDRFPTTTLELRAQSPDLEGLFGLGDLFGLDLGRTTLLAGFFYQRRAITDSYFTFDVDDAPFLGETAAAIADQRASGSLPAGIPVGLVPLPGGLIDPLSLVGKHDVFTQRFDQGGKVVAFFAQTEWRFLPRWVLQLGGRYSKEEKIGDWSLSFDSPPPSTLLTALGLQEFTAEQSLSENQFQPKVSLNWQPTQQLSLFAHWTRGFKGGGFNAFAYTPKESDLVYQAETTTEWGVDFKASFMGGTLRPNLSLYRMDAKNFQVLGREKPPVTTLPVIGSACTALPDPVGYACLPPAVLGLGTTRVFNAPLAYAQGVEGDVTWLSDIGLSLFATLGYNDTKYVDFTQNECPANDMHPTCNATGRPFAFAPRWDATLTPSWIIDLPFFGLSLTPSLTGQYLSSELLDTDLGEDKRQADFIKINASIALGNAVQGWTFQVIGKNLTNKATSVRYGDVFANVLVAVPDSSREVFAQLRWAF